MSSYRKKQCAWISDHVPTFEQKQYLEDRGYVIVQIHSPWPGRWDSAKAIHKAMMRKCSPSIIIMVLPSSTLGGQFISLCQNIPVYQAIMVKNGSGWDWVGEWEKIDGTKYRKHVENIPEAYPQVQI